MNDSYTEVTSENIFTRTKKSIGGIFFGILLFVIAFPVLWFNEGRAVKTAKALNEVGNSYIVVNADVVDSANEGKLVYINGKAVTDETLSDGLFSVQQQGIKLNRRVEMYQWKETQKQETKEKIGGTKETTTTYNYNKEWSSSPTNSSSFKIQDGHMNPTMQYQSESYRANNVTVGAFTLNSSLQGKINSTQNIPLTQEHLKKLPTDIQAMAKLSSGGIYLGENPGTPKVGDYRISFSVVPSDLAVSILAKQQNKSFVPYVASNGKSLQFLETGNVGPDEIVGQAKASNTTLTWILRGVGMALMFIGLSLIAAPLSVMASVIPALGRIVGTAFGLVSFLISLALSAIVIAIAWVFYRPVIGIALLAAAIAFIFMGVKFGKKQKAVAPPPPASSASAPPPPPPAGNPAAAPPPPPQ